MFIEKVVIQDYIPFRGVPISKLAVDLKDSNAQLIIGDNGSGKSSLMRELTPLPPVSSAYGPNGLRRLEIVHDRVQYVLESDFSRRDQIHSFVKNGVELNESGNAGIQRNLAETEFGLTKTLEEVMTCECSLAHIKKNDRKSLLFELHPQELTFLLNHHKQTCSKIRDLRSKLKMMAGMESEIRDQLIDEKEYTHSMRRKTEMEEREKQLVQFQYVLEQEMRRLQNLPEWNPNVNMNDALKIVEKLSAMAGEMACRVYHTPTSFGSNWEEETSKYRHQLDIFNEKHSGLVIRAKQLKETLAKYDAVEGTTVKEESEKLQRQLTQIDERIKQTGWNTTIPSLSGMAEEFLERMGPELLSLAERIRDSNGIVWPKKAVELGRMRLMTWTRELENLKTTIDDINTHLDRNGHDLRKTKEAGAPDNCDRNCALKRRYEAVLDEMHQREVKLKQDRDRLVKHRESLAKRTTKLKTALESAEVIIDEQMKMRGILGGIPTNVRNWLLQNDKLINCLRHNATGLETRINQMINNTKLGIKTKKLEEERKEIKHQLNALLSSNLPVEKLVKDQMVQSQNDLQAILSEMERCGSAIFHLKLTGRQTARLSKLRTDAKELVNQYIVMRSGWVLKELHDFHKRKMAEIEKERNELLQRISDLNKLKEKQNSLKSRLNETIVSQMKKLKTDLNDYQLLEPILSPTYGLPHKRMVKFINSLFVTMNEIIRSVWGYSLEMNYLDPNKQLDYQFAVTVNEGHTVPDCSLCSKGEKEILNMAWVFALCRCLGLGKRMPIRMDEPDGGLSDGNRNRVLSLISDMMASGDVRQLILIDHHHSLFDAFPDCRVLCLNSENIILPAIYNNHCTIK